MLTKEPKKEMDFSAFSESDSNFEDIDSLVEPFIKTIYEWIDSHKRELGGAIYFGNFKSGYDEIFSGKVASKQLFTGNVEEFVFNILDSISSNIQSNDFQIKIYNCNNIVISAQNHDGWFDMKLKLLNKPFINRTEEMTSGEVVEHYFKRCTQNKIKVKY